MRLALTAFTTALLLIPAAGSAVQPSDQLAVPGVTGEDNRVSVESTEYPWTAIGRVNNTLGPFCTGTLIGPRQVLTAAHCLWNPRTGSWLPACALHFLAGYYRGEYAAHSLVLSYRLTGGFSPKSAPPNDAPAQDWAVLTLADDLSEVVRPLASVAFDKKAFAELGAAGGTLVQAGYNRDYAHILTLNQPCELGEFLQNDRLVRHHCDATYGASGSPILLERNGLYQVAALLVGLDGQGVGIAVTGSTFHEALKANDHDGAATSASAEAC